MTVEEIISYTNTRLAESKLTLSEEGIKGIKKRYLIPLEKDGGYSPFWKTASITEIPKAKDVISRA